MAFFSSTSNAKTEERHIALLEKFIEKTFEDMGAMDKMEKVGGKRKSKASMDIEAEKKRIKLEGDKLMGKLDEDEANVKKNLQKLEELRKYVKRRVAEKLDLLDETLAGMTEVETAKEGDNKSLKDPEDSPFKPLEFDECVLEMD